MLEDLFGVIAVRGYRKGCRVGEAVKPMKRLPTPSRFQEPWIDHGADRCFDVAIDGRTLAIHPRPGVFSWDRLDAGTQALLGIMAIETRGSGSRSGLRLRHRGCSCGVPPRSRAGC